jgi:hypothetical protein
MRFKYLFLMVAMLMALALACGGDDDSSGDSDTPADTDVLFEDDFADSGGGWDTSSTDEFSVDVSNGQYVVSVVPAEFYLSSVVGESLSDVHIETTMRNTGQATDNAFGVICNFQDNDNHYFMGFGSDGFYAIVRAQGGTTQRLTSAEDLWIPSDDIPVNAASYQIGADCADGRLALYVNGTLIAEVNDSTFTSGDVGVFVATFEQGNAEVTFDNFVVTER